MEVAFLQGQSPSTFSDYLVGVVVILVVVGMIVVALRTKNKMLSKTFQFIGVIIFFGVLGLVIGYLLVSGGAISYQSGGWELLLAAFALIGAIVGGCVWAIMKSAKSRATDR